jgi:hypothetical protein
LAILDVVLRAEVLALRRAAEHDRDVPALVFRGGFDCVANVDEAVVRCGHVLLACLARIARGDGRRVVALRVHVDHHAGAAHEGVALHAWRNEAEADALLELRHNTVGAQQELADVLPGGAPDIGGGLSLADVEGVVDRQPYCGRTTRYFDIGVGTGAGVVGMGRAVPRCLGEWAAAVARVGIHRAVRGSVAAAAIDGSCVISTGRQRQDHDGTQTTERAGSTHSVLLFLSRC